MLYGSDISAYQSESVPVGDFCIIKVTEGLSYESSKWKAQWRDAKAKKEIVGGYHYPHYDNDAVAEADHFCDTILPLLEVGDFVVLDHESPSPPNPQSAATWAKRWLVRVQQRLDRLPVVYSNQFFARAGYCSGLGNYPWWAAVYNNDPGNVPVPIGPFSSWWFHQYTDKPYDKDVFRGTKDDLFFIGSPTKGVDEMAEVGSLGVDGKQQIAAATVAPVLFSTVYEDNANVFHEGKDGKGYSIFPPDGKRECLASALFRIQGLHAGDKVAVAITRDTKKDSKGAWVPGDEAWHKVYTVGDDNEIADDFHAQFGTNTGMRLRFVLGNRGPTPLVVAECMWKATFVPKK